MSKWGRFMGGIMGFGWGEGGAMGSSGDGGCGGRNDDGGLSG